jgi:hypothetical protein
MQKHCLHCNTVFTVKRKDKAYCSHSCRQMAYMGRKVGGEFPLRNVNIRQSETSSQSVNKSHQNVNDAPVNAEKQPASEQNTSKKTSPTHQNVNSFDETSTQSVNKTKGNYAEDIENRSYHYVTCEWMEELKMRYAMESDLELISPKNEAIRWVCIRYRGLLECLLTLSNLKRIKWEDMAEVSNAFTFFTCTVYFKQLPSYYHYTSYILFLCDSLKTLCEDTCGETPINFQLKFNTRKELIYQRYEIAQIYPKMSFTEIIADFTELHRKEIEKHKQEKEWEENRKSVIGIGLKPWQRRYRKYKETGNLDFI